jgi:hypothetical protein
MQQQWYPLHTSLEPINSQGCATRQWEPITGTTLQTHSHIITNVDGPSLSWPIMILDKH